ncbi:MAG: hypothetical protein ISQ11_13670 [Planctomycetes bacterium]|nr:hypothetical protein [Planctomycetota bacterium]
MKHISLALLTLALALSLSPAAQAQPQEARRGHERSAVPSEAPAARDGQSAREEGRSDRARAQRRPRRDAQGIGGADKLRRRAPEGQRRRSGADGAARKDSAGRQAAAKRGRTARRLRDARGRSGVQSQRRARTQRGPQGRAQRGDAQRSGRQRAGRRPSGHRQMKGRAPVRVQRENQKGSRGPRGRSATRRSRR